jgi:hypothetical protein
MLVYIVKFFLSAFIILIVTEISKKDGVLGGLIKSLPLVSLISFVFVYIETKDIEKVRLLSTSTFWFVIPTLPMFLIFPWLLGLKLGFWVSFSISIIVLTICYLITSFILGKLGILV